MKSNPGFAWQIDEEKPEDVEAVYRVNLKAFERKDEAEVVNQLRLESPIFYSYVARVQNQVVGHILFTPAQIVQSNGLSIPGLGLAPMAVTPEFQGKGVGSALCIEAIRRIDSMTYPFVIVLGHPDFYPRFEFERASLFGIRSSYADVPEDCFMIRILDHETMSGVSGVAYYRPEFDTVS